ncbi:MAG: Crp/Fnr family transcriptional regulator [Actinomycetota bacterium]
MSRVTTAMTPMYREQSQGRGKRPRMGKRGAHLLAAVPLFSELSSRHLKRMAELAEEVQFKAGDPVVQEGQPGGTFFVILEGEAKVTRKGRKLNELYPGDFFGEVSLLDGGPRTATVTAETPIVAIRLFRKEFSKLIAADPEMALKIIAELASRIRRTHRSVTG